MESTTKKIPGSIQEMDGLRGIAILFVLVIHILPNYLGHNFVISLVGDSAVPLFFAVSGYCISYALFRRNAMTGEMPSPTDFLKRRFRRIYPPYIIAVGLFLAKVLIIDVIKNHEGISLAEFGRMVFFNVTLSQLFMGNTPFVNPAFWSLCVEFQFYLAIALLLAIGTALRANGFIAVRALTYLITLVSAAVILLKDTHVLHFEPRFWFDFFLHYVPLFAAGVTTANLHIQIQQGKLSKLVLAEFLVAMACLIGLASRGAFIAALFYTGMPILMNGKSLIPIYQKFLNFKPLQTAGKTSYSIYLIHGLGIAFLGSYAAKYTHNHSPMAIVVFLMTLVSVFVLSYAFYNSIEIRFIRDVDRKPKTVPA